jgi:hypothetical protein
VFDEGLILFDVLPVNDAPTNSLPAPPTVDEDGAVTITGLGVTDVDAAGGDNRMQVTLSVQHGTLTLGQTTGLTFSDGIGTGDATMTLPGDLAAVGAALGSLTNTPLANFNGEDSLRIVSNDLGNFGAGGPLTDTDELAITINAVNDAPIALDDTASTTDQAPVTIDVLANDTDAELPDDVLTIVAVGTPSPNAGSVAISGGKLIYIPTANTQDPVTFTYMIRDQAGAESTATVTVNVQDITQPQVSDVLIHFGDQTYSLLNNPDRVLSWVNINAIEVVFSEDVQVDRDDLALTGLNVSNYAVSGFQYDSGSHVARWTLLSPLDVDLVLLNLDGDSPDGVADLTGNFLQGGDLSRTLKILAGDFNGDGAVTSADAVGIRNQFAVYLPNDQSPSIFADLNGDGVVDVNDYIQLRGRVGRRFPTSR